MSVNEKTEYTGYELIATAVADTLQFNSCQFALVDTDAMRTALIDVSHKGKCKVLNSYELVAKPDYFITAAGEVTGDVYGANKVLEVCAKGRNAFMRYIKTDGATDEEFSDKLSCKSLMDVYDRNYKADMEKLANAVKSMAANTSEIVLVGKFAKFYPTEHTIKKALTPMPFLPLEGFYVRDTLCTDTAELAAKGKAILERIEKDTKRVFHNVMIQLKKLTGNELVDFLFVLAKKDDGFDKLENPTFSGDVTVHNQDPVVLFADSTKYTVRLPLSIFSGDETAKVQFALGVENDVPKLLVKKGALCAKVDIDSKIYSEV